MHNGKPGTGKTDTIRSIIEVRKGQATFLVVEGFCNLKIVFELAELLSPAVICLDDLGLICGDRNNPQFHSMLDEFMTLMGGVQ